MSLQKILFQKAEERIKSRNFCVVASCSSVEMHKTCRRIVSTPSSVSRTCWFRAWLTPRQ
jgi:hypothetical protein